MFNINDVVVHYREGLSTILSINKMNEKDYFLLKVNRVTDSETIYVPVETADNIIRHILNEKEADKLLKYLKGINIEYNANTKQRRDFYKKMLSSGKVKDIAYLYRQLYFYYKTGGEESQTMKLGPVDIEMLSNAKNILLDELALSYKVKRDTIDSFIEKRINKL